LTHWKPYVACLHRDLSYLQRVLSTKYEPWYLITLWCQQLVSSIGRVCGPVNLIYTLGIFLWWLEKIIKPTTSSELTTILFSSQTFLFFVFSLFSLSKKDTTQAYLWCLENSVIEIDYDINENELKWCYFVRDVFIWWILPPQKLWLCLAIVMKSVLRFLCSEVFSIFEFKKVFLVIGVENLFGKLFGKCFWKLKEWKVVGCYGEKPLLAYRANMI
jgi:hypothetical protein